MERRLAEIPPEEWNNLAVDLTPKDQVLDYLMGAFPVAAMEAIETEDGSIVMKPLLDEHGAPVLSQAALRLREELVKRSLAPLKAFEESAWEMTSETTWREAWAAELAAADPWVRHPRGSRR
jgi:hypothetical protein